jgi:hypothetical protein
MIFTSSNKVIVFAMVSLLVVGSVNWAVTVTTTTKQDTTLQNKNHNLTIPIPSNNDAAMPKVEAFLKSVHEHEQLDQVVKKETKRLPKQPQKQEQTHK